MIGSITAVQQEALAAEKARRNREHGNLIGRDLSKVPAASGDGKTAPAMPPVPQPEDAHVAWAKRVLGNGYAASVTDRVDATRILDAAGMDAGQFHAGRERDTAPVGARDIAAAHLRREQAELEHGRQLASANKGYADHGIQAGPDHGVEPGHPEPEQFHRGYIDAGHGSQAPASGPPRTNPNPLPSQMRGVAVPIALSTQTRASAIPFSVAASYAMGSPSD